MANALLQFIDNTGALTFTPTNPGEDAGSTSGVITSNGAILGNILLTLDHALGTPVVGAVIADVHIIRQMDSGTQEDFDVGAATVFAPESYVGSAVTTDNATTALDYIIRDVPLNVENFLVGVVARGAAMTTIAGSIDRFTYGTP